MSAEAEGIRLQKYLSRAGAASRREAETLMGQGRVRVDGEVVRELGTRVVPGRSVVELDGVRVEPESTRWIAVHKRAGTLTTRMDPGGRPTVYDGLPADFGSLKYLGRLDRDTEGLLLLSNDGDLMHRLLHPSHEVEREYEAQVVGVPTKTTLRRLELGVLLDDGPARATSAEVLRDLGAGADLRLVLTEGRKREVRRMLDAVEHPVRHLRRVRFGPIALGELPAGAWRDLTRAEVEALRAAAPPASR